MKKDSSFTLMVIPHHGKQPYTFRLHYLTVLLLAAVIGAGLIGSALYITGAQQKAALKGKLEVVEKVKFQQDQQIQEMNQTLDELKAFGRKVKTLTGIGQEEALIKEGGGRGGPVLYWPTEEFYSPGQKGLVVNEVRDIEELKGEIYLEKQTYRELIEELGKKEELFACTPSICPVNGGYISSGFGWRRRPRPGFHKGLDLVARRGTSVRSTAAGRVVFVGWDGGYGNKVKVDHGHGFKTVYAHLDRIKVRWGEFVKKGQVVGTLGNTGFSTGPHLHYEVHHQGKRVDPIKYILVKLK
ncbi:MAG: M23 family metallopeptidase [Candidatus Ratteibacteria bacterium]|nr:M23 family metallopeptidase [Candidatus Ratteibacteria bacterium]